jgi:hypothetical protein
MIAMARNALVVCAVVAVALSAGCGGGGSDTAVTNTTLSKGQSLIDLKAAFDSGALSKDEYERERRKILDE